MTTIDGDAPTPVFVSVRPHVRESATGASDERPNDSPMPESGPLVDRYGRIHNDLRISVTDRLQPPLCVLHARSGHDISAP